MGKAIGSGGRADVGLRSRLTPGEGAPAERPPSLNLHIPVQAEVVWHGDRRIASFIR